MPRNEITAAVRSLRSRLGDTQQRFANRMGMAISTVVRYELSRPPRGRVLRDLENLAVNNGCFSEAAIFRNAFYEEFQLCGPESASQNPFQYLRLAPRNDREEELIQALLWTARYSESGTALQNIEKHLKSYSLEKAKFEAAINDAALELTIVDDCVVPGLPLTVRDRFGKDLLSLRTLLQGIGLGESDTGLASSFQVPISMIRALKKVLSDVGIPIINTVQQAETKKKHHQKHQERRDRK